MAGVEEFLAAVWGADEEGHLEGVHFIASPDAGGRWQHFPVETTAEAVHKADELSGHKRGVYFACAEYAQAGSRKSDNATGARAFWLDIDCGEAKATEGKGYATQKEAVGALAHFCKAAVLPAPTGTVSSGNGLHVYWMLDGPLPRDEWQRLARKLKVLTEQHGLLADPSRTADIASVLRVPGTMNWKDAGNPKPVELLRLTGAVGLDAMTVTLGAVRTEMMIGSVPTWAQTPKLPPPAETPENIATVKAMLACIPANCDRDSWRSTCWAVQATDWGCAVALAREWSMTAPEEFNEVDFDGVAISFNPDGGIGFGSLVTRARQYGYTGPMPWGRAEGGAIVADGERLTGYGGDVKNGQVFANVWRDKLLFVYETGECLWFTESGWNAAPPREEDRAAKHVLQRLRELAGKAYTTDPDNPRTKRLMAHVERTSKAANLRAMIEMARSEPGMTVSLRQFDADPTRLGVLNGVLDLSTGRLLPVSPDVLVSKRCNVAYKPGAECPAFLRFIEEIQPGAEERAFLQRWVGYCLTGDVSAQKFLFLHGSGANGKSVFVELLAWLLGDYARKIATEMLMHHQRSPQGPSPDIVALKGLRLAYANETEEGVRLAESRVKDLTGGDTMTGRVPYAKADITFAPTHKLVIVGNHRPEITDNSLGMWRRVALVPFAVTVPPEKRDAHLLEKLKAEGPGILNWALDGLQCWKANGLAVPAQVGAATAAYREEQDIIGEWVSEHCTVGAGLTALRADAYRAYRTWALGNGHRPMAQKRLSRKLSERGFLAMPDKRSLGGLGLSAAGRNAALS